MLGERVPEVFDQKQPARACLREETRHAHAPRLEQRAHLEKGPRPAALARERDVRRVGGHLHHDGGGAVREERAGRGRFVGGTQPMELSRGCSARDGRKHERGGLVAAELGEPALDFREPGRHAVLTVEYGRCRAQARR